VWIRNKTIRKSIIKKFQQHEKHPQRSATSHKIINKTFEMLRVASTHVRLWNLESNNKDQEKLRSSRNVVLPQQCRAEVWWCPRRLLDWMPHYQILVLSSGVWCSLLLDIRCWWRHNLTSYSGLQPTFWLSFLAQHAYLRTPDQG